MTTLSAHTSRAIHNKGMQAVYGIAAEYDVDAADVIALLGTTSHTSPAPSRLVSRTLTVTRPDGATQSVTTSFPSQPLQAPADATTDGEKQPSSLPTEPSVEIIPDIGMPISPPPSPLPGDPADGADIQPNRVSAPSAAFSPAPAKGDQVRACHAEHPDWPANVIAAHLGMKPTSVRAFASLLRLSLPSQRDYVAAQAAKTSDALRIAVQPETPPAAIPEPGIEAPAAEPPAKRITLADRIRAHLADHPDATARDIANATGKTITSVSWAAIKAEIPLRKLTSEEHAEASRRGAQGTAKPSEAFTPPSEAPEPPAVAPEPRKAVVYRHSSPPGRFYVRDREGRYLHMSLLPCPTGPGPLMTTKRADDWCDNSQRFKGARKLWPEIATMRKEGAAS